MILDMVKSVVGVLPKEYEFIYYIVTLGACICTIAIPLVPFIVLFNKLFGRRR